MRFVSDKLELNDFQNKSKGRKVVDWRTNKKIGIFNLMRGQGQPKKGEGRYLEKQVKTVHTYSVTVE